MKRITAMSFLLGMSVLGCGAPISPSADHRSGVGGRDYLVGWYKLPDRHWKSREIMPGPGTLIPVFKIDETYYSLCRGFEIPLKECPEGLEWALTSSSMVGTTIGLDETSEEYYIRIVDSRAQYPADWSTSDENQGMTRIDKPAGLLDPTCQPPRTNDDFVGWYQAVWLAWFRFEVRKEGEKYLVIVPALDGKSEEEPRGLTPLPDQLGFTGFDRKERNHLTYNEALKRFELTKTSSSVIRMPLARAPSSIGIPSWH